jgi:hypothetical protein
LDDPCRPMAALLNWWRSARRPLDPRQILLNQRAGNGAGRRPSPVGRPSIRAREGSR